MESRGFAGIGASIRAPQIPRTGYTAPGLAERISYTAGAASGGHCASPHLADGEAIEIRPVYDATEFPEEMLSAGLGTRERLLRDQAAKASLS